MASRPSEVAIGFLLCAVAYTMLLFGFRTRTAQLASLLCVLSLHGRLLMLENSGDAALSQLCLWTLFLPTGRRYSVDSLRASLRAFPDRDDGDLADRDRLRPDPRPFVSWAVLVLLVQLAIIYFLSAVQKTGATWRMGSAVYDVLHQDRIVTGLGLWVRGWLPPAASRVLSWSVRITEFLLPALLLSPVATRSARRLALVLVVALHLGFALFINLAIFVPAMIAFVPNFVSTEDWDRLARWSAGRRGNRLVLYDGRSGVCFQAARDPGAAGSRRTTALRLHRAPPGDGRRARRRRALLRRARSLRRGDRSRQRPALGLARPRSPSWRDSFRSGSCWPGCCASPRCVPARTPPAPASPVTARALSAWLGLSASVTFGADGQAPVARPVALALPAGQLPSTRGVARPRRPAARRSAGRPRAAGSCPGGDRQPHHQQRASRSAPAEMDGGQRGLSAALRGVGALRARHAPHRHEHHRRRDHARRAPCRSLQRGHQRAVSFSRLSRSPAARTGCPRLRLRHDAPLSSRVPPGVPRMDPPLPGTDRAFERPAGLVPRLPHRGRQPAARNARSRGTPAPASSSPTQIERDRTARAAGVRRL